MINDSYVIEAPSLPVSTTIERVLSLLKRIRRSSPL